MAFSPKGRQLAVAKGPAVSYVDGEGLAVATPQGYTEVNGIHPVSTNGFLRVYQLSDTEEPKEDRYIFSPARRVGYTSCGRWMALGEDSGIVRLWDLKSSEDEYVLEEHSKDIVKLMFLPNGRQLISMDYGGTICLWDTESGECVDVLELYRSHISISPCETFLVIASESVVRL